MLRTLQIDPAEQHEAAGAIYHESRRLEALSYKLLSLLSLSDERLELAPVDLTDLWPRLRMACPQVPLLTPQGGAVVHGDADLLLDLLCNLVQNAAKASPAGMPVTVLLADAGDTVALTVQDHGCGIPADKLARVTEPFYMVDKSRARKQGGSGMGLALCQRIAAVPWRDAANQQPGGRGHRRYRYPAQGGAAMKLWKKPRLAAALCAVVVLVCAAAPAVFLSVVDAASLGHSQAVADPYTAPTPTADDYYLLRQLSARQLTQSKYTFQPGDTGRSASR